MTATSAARWNQRLGWLLLIASLGWAAWLDPFSLGERDPAHLLNSTRMAARQAQAVVIGMAFLQLIVAHVLESPAFAGAALLWTRRLAATFSALGATIYVLGYLLSIGNAALAWLIPVGAAFNFLAFALLSLACWRAARIAGGQEQAGHRELRIILTVVAFGMLLDAGMGLFATSPDLFLPSFLGPADGVRLRMLRLARAAAIALPVLALLFEELISSPDGLDARRKSHWAGAALMWGSLGMPLVLSAAAFTAVSLKYLLPLPAFSIFAGTTMGMLLARQGGKREAWGWGLIVAGMSAGLLMGMYAFDGPLPAPHFLGAYNDFARRLSRLGHAYAIVLGLLAIFAARRLDKANVESSKAKIVMALLAASSGVTIGVIVLVAANAVSSSWLGVGPALVAVAALGCVLQSREG